MSHAISIPFEPTSAALNVDPSLSLSDALDSLERYRANPVEGFETLRDNTDLCADPRVAAVFIECALAARRIDLAEMVLPLTQDETGVLAAMVLMANKKPKQALAALTSIPEDARHKVYALGLRVQANVMTRQYDAASKAVYDWSLATPSSPQPFRVMGNALTKKGDARAERWYKRAINISGGGSGAVLDLASFLIKQGRTDEARDNLNTLSYVTGRTKRRKQKLLKAL